MCSPGDGCGECCPCFVVSTSRLSLRVPLPHPHVRVGSQIQRQRLFAPVRKRERGVVARVGIGSEACGEELGAIRDDPISCFCGQARAPIGVVAFLMPAYVRAFQGVFVCALRSRNGHLSLLLGGSLIVLRTLLPARLCQHSCPISSLPPAMPSPPPDPTLPGYGQSSAPAMTVPTAAV
ncbi:hypothetical protein P171DRAFT_432226 [Karstenula rhodostoma CBS 690.94]|uniref:Uncharacterized protein n=1 Tax=Karstenula rhodostoma CBS 690.94 TaxID=1392251 RepID=A0A9P4PFM0_9PLEO|nr:hypothetical protein P171DRAFT_432226 [Karstenula rhodostoma CBS 690.94]